MTETRDDVVLELLEKGKQRIASPDKWIKGRAAEDANGMPPDDMLKAVKCCLIGAIQAETRSLSYYYTQQQAVWQMRNDARDILAENLPAGWRELDNPLVEYNDDPATTHEDVMRVYDRAIESRKRMEGKI